MSKQEKMELLKKELALLEQEDEVKPEVKPEQSESESEDETPQKKPRKPMVKYERTEKQKQSMLKALEVKTQNALKRKTERDAIQAELRKETERKLVEKAIKIKKKHIKKERILEELSDDETEHIQKPNFKRIKKPIVPKKTFTFFT